VTLSGGQKARLGLARAIYVDADVYLLDDPLSAVDAGVGKHIFERCIQGFLGHKLRVLVTHQVHHLAVAELVVALGASGDLLACGTISEVLEQHPKLTEALSQNASRAEEDKDKEQGFKSMTATAAEAETGTDLPLSCLLPSQGSKAEDDADLATAKEGSSVLFADEARQVGHVTRDTYKTYFRAMGPPVYRIFLFILLLVPQAAMVGVDVYLAVWVDDQEGADARGEGAVATEQRLLFYGLLVFATVALSAGRAIAIVHAMVTAAKHLHNAMLSAVIDAPMRLFDTQPMGRILNRFSKDLGFMDDLLPWAVVDFIQLFVDMLGAVIVACSVNPWVLLAVIPLAVFLVYLRRFYLSSSRELKRLEAVQRSPLYSHFSATLEGSVVLRCHRAANASIERMHM
jgi:ATP-binding cassette subfamily C (CFTR/MRP) protein 4